MSDPLLLESSSGNTCGWSYTVSPPAQGDWYDLDTVVADVLARLRLQSTDVDEPRIRALVPAAAVQINDELDRVWAMTPAGTVDTADVDEDLDVTELLETNVTPDILDALSRLTIEMFRRGRSDRDGNFPVEIGSALDVVVGDLSTHKSRFGIA